MKMEFDFHEINDMGRNYKGGERIVRAEIKQSMTRSVIAIEADAKRRVPTDTHTLQRSLTHEVTPSGSSVTGRAGTNLEAGDGRSLGEIIEKGRTPGRMPPPGVLLPWMTRHGIDHGSAPKKSGGYFSIEFAVARAINKRKRPHPFLKPAFDVNRLKIRTEFGTALPNRIFKRLAGGNG